MGQSAAAAAEGGVHGFPAVLTSFIGRARAGGELGGLLSENRLVTVTGPGGAGKTRLACAVGRRVAGRFADGVWLAELAPVRDPALVAAAVAAALGVREQPGVPAAAALARVLARQQQLLLVLDNCEHVIGAAAALCAGLLPAADDVRILTTSREPLRIAGEARYRLAPLALPDPDDTAGVQESEAVALFADRARQADTRFTLTSENAPAVARLVRRLDGMPLAIELAAARVEALGLAQLLDRIGDRFGLLVAGDRLAAGRQRSLAATVDWSYQLLNELERRVFRRISVFPAPFTLEAAETVAGAGAGPAVLRLVDCSLLVPPRPGPDGRSRYVMLETLRAYGAQRLAEAGEQPEAAAALAGFALGVADQAAAGLSSSAGELDAARWLDAEDATVHQALDWALQHDPGTARAHLREATELESRMNVPLLLADCLDWCGHLCARTKQWADALTAWAAQASFQQAGGTMQEPLPDARRREEPHRKARQALGSRQAAAAEHRGAAMEAGTASGFALLLTAPRPPDAPADPGLSQLSGRERELVTLVAQGRTDAQIAGQLYISIRTVRSHLDRIRDKTGCRRRADLTRLALSTGLI